jgi:hypothetical protein
VKYRLSGLEDKINITGKTEELFNQTIQEL